MKNESLIYEDGEGYMMIMFEGLRIHFLFILILRGPFDIQVGISGRQFFLNLDLSKRVKPRGTYLKVTT